MPRRRFPVLCDGFWKRWKARGHNGRTHVDKPCSSKLAHRVSSCRPISPPAIAVTGRISRECVVMTAACCTQAEASGVFRQEVSEWCDEYIWLLFAPVNRT